MAAPERFAEPSDSPLAPRAPSIQGTFELSTIVRSTAAFADNPDIPETVPRTESDPICDMDRLEIAQRSSRLYAIFFCSEAREASDSGPVQGHHAPRQRGSGVAARGAGAAGGPGAAGGRAPSRSFGRCRVSSPRRGVSARAAAI